MLVSLFGNKTIEKVLFFIQRYENGYAREISETFSISVNGIQQQLKRLENGNILVSRLYGRVRLYQFNPRYPFLRELRALLESAMAHLSREEIKRYYMKRTRPRKPGKPI